MYIVHCTIYHVHTYMLVLTAEDKIYGFLNPVMSRNSARERLVFISNFTQEEIRKKLKFVGDGENDNFLELEISKTRTFGRMGKNAFRKTIVHQLCWIVFFCILPIG